MTRMKRLSLILFLLLASFSCSLQAQDFALKTNGLYWLTTTPNVGMEFALSRKVTMDLSAAYNPWTFKDDKKNALLACTTRGEILVLRKV